MSKTSLLHVSYASELRADDEALRDGIVSQANENNARLGITGCIAFDGRNCAQILEGPHDAVDALFAKIEQDDRHGGVVELVRTSIEELHFEGWTMRRWPISQIYQMSETVSDD